MIKKIILGVSGILLLLFIWQHELLLYGINQASGQLKIIWNTKPIEYYLDDPNFPDSLKLKLRLVQDIRQFAIEKLGIKENENYTTVYDQKGMPVLWLVTASRPFQLEAKEWQFPILGTFSYKGFFKYESALSEEKHLIDQGYDTNIRTVSGWSTLGWLKDPIMTNMLQREIGSLANLIIHELTHTTIYIKDSVQFNENLASFIGDQGAKRYLAERYGDSSQELNEYTHALADSERFSQYVLAGADSLKILYDSFSKDFSEDQKLNQKKAFMKHFVNQLDTVNFFNKRRFSGYFEELPNNTFFLSFERYRGNVSMLEKIYQERFQGDISLMLAFYKKHYPSI